MDQIDRDLARASQIFLDDLSDETDAELHLLLPRLEDAGYVVISGASATGDFWHFTTEGVRRQKSLGLI